MRGGLLGFVLTVLKSEPGQYSLLKACFAFPAGLLISAGLFLVVIQPMDLDPDTQRLVGAVSGLVLSLGFAVSLQVRCMTLLVLPTFFGRAGRASISAFAIIFLLSGPVDNIVDNLREVTRSMSCLAQLLANHTMAKWKLRLSPLKGAVEELQEEGFLIEQIGQAVEKAFQPIRKELEDQNEVQDLEEDLQEVEEVVKESQEGGPPPNPFGVKQIEDKHKTKPGQSEADVVEDKWAKKLDLRCDDVFGKAIIRCRDWFGDMWDKCLDALWILGYVLCLPLKMTFFCEVMRMVGGALGLDCDSLDVLDPGIGETYVGSKEMIEEVEHGMKVQLQYKLVDAKTPLNFVSPEEIKARALHEYEEKARWVRLLTLIVKRLLALTFLLVFKDAFAYQKKFLTNFQHDNIYITHYFRRIDARRRAAGKKTLLPLKKSEKQVVIFPSSLALMAHERRTMHAGLAKLFFRLMVTAIIIWIDLLLVWILDVINRNSRIDYHQQGKQQVKITVQGTGFMAHIVRMFLTTFNTNHTLDSVTSNVECLPRATPPPTLTNIMVVGVHVATLLFMLSEAYGLRLRRAICAFFYRKREKRRILYVYNELLKKRKGYLRHMRHRVRKQVRDRTLRTQTSVLTALRRQFPRLCACLGVLKSSKDSCLICKDPEGKDFVRCPTDGCNWGYCPECWGDVKQRCYACGGKYGESETEDERTSTSDSSDLTDDEHFLR